MPNPYDQAMMNPLDAQRMQAAANALRRRETFATIGQLTGDPVLGKFATGERETITSRREGLQKARQAARKRRDCKPSGMPGQIICGGELQEVPGYYDRVTEREKAKNAAKIEAARVGAGSRFNLYRAKLADKQSRIPESAWTGAKGIAEGLAQIGNLKDAWEKSFTTPGVMRPGLDITQETLGNIGLGGVGRWGEETFDLRSEDARGLRAQASVVLDRLRNSIFGSALTSYEISEGAKSNPLASGISDSEMQSRMEKLMRYLTSSARTKISGRQPPGDLKLPEWLSEDYGWTPPGDTSPAAGAAPQKPASPPEGWTPEQWKLFQEIESPSGG